MSDVFVFSTFKSELLANSCGMRAFGHFWNLWAVTGTLRHRTTPFHQLLSYNTMAQSVSAHISYEKSFMYTLMFIFHLADMNIQHDL